MAEKSIEWEDRQVDLATGAHLTQEYLKLNANGVVPTLIHDGRIVIESSVICEYLEELHPKPALMPDGPHGRATVRAWMRYIEEVPTASVRVPSFNTLFSSALSQWSDNELRSQADRRPLRKHFYLKLHGGKFSEAEYDASLERLSQTISRMEAALAGGPWLLGRQFTLADVMLIPLITRMEDIGLAYLWAGAPRVTDWFAHVKTRPSFDVAFYPSARIMLSSAAQ